MGPWIAELANAASGLQSLGVSGGVVAFFLLVQLIRRAKTEDDQRASERLAKSWDELEEDLEAERAKRRAEEQRSDKLMASGRWWTDRAYRERWQRLDDRSRYMHHARASGVDPLVLAEPEPLPEFVEEQQLARE